MLVSENEPIIVTRLVQHIEVDNIANKVIGETTWVREIVDKYHRETEDNGTLIGILSLVISSDPFC